MSSENHVTDVDCKRQQKTNEKVCELRHKNIDKIIDSLDRRTWAIIWLLITNLAGLSITLAVLVTRSYIEKTPPSSSATAAAVAAAGRE